MDSYYDIPVIIPSYEPDDKLITLLEALKQTGISHVVVVDDGSGAQYETFFELAEEMDNCTVLHHAVNLGKGRATDSIRRRIFSPVCANCGRIRRH